MTKLEKAKKLEAARIVLVTAADMIQIARDKILDVNPETRANYQFALHSVVALTCEVVEMQNKLEGKS